MFIREYGFIAIPLTILLKKGTFNWSKEADVAFNELKIAITQQLVLRLPDFFREFTIECNASEVGLGIVLMQEDQPIAFYSKVLEGRTLLLSTYKKELLALMSVMPKWRSYMLGQTFKIKTDQHALNHLLE